MSDGTSNPVSVRLRRLEKRVEEGGHYGFQQDIWKEAADEIDRLTERLAGAYASVNLLTEMLEAKNPQEATGPRWVSDQYQKIQDFVISRRLFKGSPPDKSHADIVLELAAKALEGGQPVEPQAFHPEGAPWDLVAHLYRQRAFSEKTFGPGVRTAGVCDHIRKELAEIEADPHDLMEWVDVILLALDGAWRAGYLPGEIVAAMEAKQTKNEGRTWPDWRTAELGKAIEHVRSPSTKGETP